MHGLLGLYRGLSLGCRPVKACHLEEAAGNKDFSHYLPTCRPTLLRPVTVLLPRTSRELRTAFPDFERHQSPELKTYMEFVLEDLQSAFSNLRPSDTVVCDEQEQSWALLPIVGKTIQSDAHPDRHTRHWR